MARKGEKGHNAHHLDGLSPNERFDKFTPNRHENDCWIWQGPVSTNGYGNIHFQRKTVSAHKFSYERFIGPVPAGMKICHRCDTPLCVNPEHFFLGTHRQNMDDMLAKGRKRNKALTREKVEEIRKAYANGVSAKKLAEQYGVNARTITHAVKFKTWNGDRRYRGPNGRYQSKCA